MEFVSEQALEKLIRANADADMMGALALGGASQTPETTVQPEPEHETPTDAA